MQIYLVQDQKSRTHQFIYPDRVWEQSPDGWISRSLNREDHKQRLLVCESLVKNAVSARRLLPGADRAADFQNEEEDENG